MVRGEEHRPVLRLPQINVLALTGSSKVADHLKKQHPKSQRLRAILGLDAKNAAIIMRDADIELTCVFRTIVTGYFGRT